MTNLQTRVPTARRDDLVTTETQDGLLIYDQSAHELHQLDHSAASAWRLCDGTRTVAELAFAAGISVDSAWMALVQLSNAALLEEPFPGNSTVGDTSRRRLIQRAAVAAPVLISISAPTAAYANSDTCMNPCKRDSECRGDCPVCKQFSPDNAATFCCNSKDGTQDYCFSK